MEGATQVFGNSKARWFRDGKYYDRNGQPITEAEAAEPEFEVEAEPEPPEETTPTYAPAPPGDDGRRATLGAMRAARLAELVKTAGGRPARSRRENIDWLLANTT